jgi:hypothetical protein
VRNIYHHIIKISHRTGIGANFFHRAVIFTVRDLSYLNFVGGFTPYGERKSLTVLVLVNDKDRAMNDTANHLFNKI